MPSESDNYRLLLSIISQITDEKGRLRDINWHLVADDLNLERAAAASLRWCRFKNENILNKPKISGGVAAKAQNPRAKTQQRPTGKNNNRAKLSEEKMNLRTKSGDSDGGSGETRELEMKSEDICGETEVKDEGLEPFYA
ncbi:hypothetical protein QTJ16_001674 [Diplocarpon rosae]|uniref:Myb-like DNA-binding domain-containing protein n=1 Tax=Diplocarpon rosae TaxID=946125 RepID=A0AAD9T3J0_9HELO|nr:hypothetical protein QTJ16_001674 [Diplocarpon rosae]